MKTKIILMLCISLGIFIETAAQQISIISSDDFKKGEVIDTIIFRVQYNMTAIQDTLATDKQPIAETMMLDVGKKTSLFYSYTQQIKDSVLQEDVKKRASQEEMRRHAEEYGGGIITYRIYKNHPTGKVTTLDKLGISKFRCEEPSETPEWILSPDTATILSYLCHKASCTFKGRQYEVWYTLEIPRSDGPWKLSGLPGLILKAKDNRNSYTFECSGIMQCRRGETILLSGGTFETVSRKALNKLYERYIKDPVGFITSTQPNVHIKMTGPTGNEINTPRNIPYNPIELSEK